MDHRIAAIGYGGFGSFAIQAVQALPDVEVVALAGTNAERAQAAAQRLGVPRAFDDYRRMLDEVACDVVAILTPPHAHAEPFIECARRGKHIICEKPLALTREEGDAMIAAAREAGVVATVNHMMRCSPLFQRLKKLCESGALGELKHLSFHNHAGASALADDHWFWDERKSGGVLVEHGVHFFDAVAWLVGEPAAPLATQSPQRGEVWSIVAYPQRRVTADFYLHFDRSYVGEENFGLVLFTRGWARFDGWIPLRLTIHAMGCQPAETRIPQVKEAHYADLVRAVAQDVLAKIEDPRRPLTVTLDEARAALETALRATAMEEASAIPPNMAGGRTH